MRIALFTDTFHPDVNGVARTLHRFVDHLGRNGHSVALVSPTRPGPNGGAMEDPGGSRRPASPPGPPVVHHRLGGVPVPFYPELTLTRSLDRKESAALEGFAPELVHVATESTVGLSGVRWARRHGVPLVTSFHTNFPAYLDAYRLGWVKPAAWRHLRSFHGRSLRTFCPSEATRTLLRARGFHDRLSIWSRGVDADLFHPGRRRAAVRHRIAPGAERILLYVGRLAPEKRIPLLLEAFERVRGRMPSATTLVLVGDGPAAPGFRRTAPPSVRFTGYLRGEELADVYAAADLFVFPSDTETFGNVVLEAMASGLPAVVPAAGGVRELVTDGENGRVVPPGDPDAFGEAILEIVRDADRMRRWGEAARRSAERRSWSAVFGGLVREYGELAEEGRCPD